MYLLIIIFMSIIKRFILNTFKLKSQYNSKTIQNILLTQQRRK